MFASRGYQVLFVSTRGTFDSGGELDPFRHEVEDGMRVVEWMRKQEWYTGSFATFGGSYLGFTQWALLCDPPEDMTTAVIVVGPHDFGRAHWRSGALSMDIINWTNMVVMRESNFPRMMFKSIGSMRRLQPVIRSIPLWQNVERHLGGSAPWLGNIVTQPNLEDPYYQPMKLSQALENTNIPILLLSGWYDVFLGQTMEQYFRLRDRGVKVAMTIGPWDHAGAIVGAMNNRQSFEWIEKHHSGRSEQEREHAVHYYVAGAKEWRFTNQFPPSTAQHVFYLHEGNTLGGTRPSLDVAPSNFIYDPLDPTPTIGGNILNGGGRVNDSALSLRSDVLTFTTELLEKDIEVVGEPSIELTHSTDNPYADISVRISEVDERGRSSNITETFQRLDPNRGDERTILLKLNYCAHRFQRGKKIQLTIAGGTFPHFARNQGVPNEDNQASEVKSVRHTVWHGSGGLSRIVLPVVINQ
ncbi:galactose-binding domain-like protein [Dendryphion nanum]|uniref:Galactose-binding domain-like protein n=1 Tax=Dendryphion nanum TaxID=256645 RepID=A0A9P9DG78_9PLEO|nr:galactose-binding domain-like protein [Dendryphion nanum]